MGMGTHTHIWKPEEDVKCPALELSPLFFVVRPLTSLGQSWQGTPVTVLSLLLPQHEGYRSVCGHPQLLHGAGTEAQTSCLHSKSSSSSMTNKRVHGKMFIFIVIRGTKAKTTAKHHLMLTRRAITKVGG